MKSVKLTIEDDDNAALLAASEKNDIPISIQARHWFRAGLRVWAEGEMERELNGTPNHPKEQPQKRRTPRARTQKKQGKKQPRKRRPAPKKPAKRPAKKK